MKKSYFLFLIFLVSCARSEGRKETQFASNDNLYVVDMDQAETGKQLLFSSLFSRVKTIILGANDSILIGNIDKIQVDNHGIFVLDRKVKGVFLFAHDGRFIRRFGNLGRGPGEYMALFDFTLDKKDNNIYLLDNDHQKVLKYDIATGDFIRYISINPGDTIRSYHIQYNEGALFADTYFFEPFKESDLLQKIDTATGAQQNAYLNNIYNQGWENLFDIEDKVFYQVDAESSRFVQRFMDTVIYVSAEEVKPYLVLKSKNRMDVKVLERIDRSQDPFMIMSQIDSKNKVSGIHNYIENDSMILFQYRDGVNVKSLVYHIKTNKTTLYKMFTDDLLFAPDTNHWLPQFGCATDKGVYYYVNNMSFTNIKASAESGMFAPDLDQLDQLKAWDDNANPVIFFYEYKK